MFLCQTEAALFPFERVSAADGLAARPAAPALRSVSVLANSVGEGVVFRFAAVPREPITVRVFDVAGRLIRSLPETAASTGMRELIWDGRDQAGALAKAGVYFYQGRIGTRSRPVNSWLSGD